MREFKSFTGGSAGNRGREEARARLTARCGCISGEMIFRGEVERFFLFLF